MAKKSVHITHDWWGMTKVAKNGNYVLHDQRCQKWQFLLTSKLPKMVTICLMAEVAKNGNKWLLTCLLGVRKGLRYLHEKGVFHRDLTAQNVLLDESNPPIPKIANFGNSHITNINPIYERDSTGFPGTLPYMLPEACSHAGCSSPKLDIFSFGHLSLFVCTQTFQCNFLPEKYVHTHEGGRKERCVPSEVERREEYFRMIYDEQYHPLRALMRKCLDDIPDERPSAGGVVCELEIIRVSPNL